MSPVHPDRFRTLVIPTSRSWHSHTLDERQTELAISRRQVRYDWLSLVAQRHRGADGLRASDALINLLTRIGWEARVAEARRSRTPAPRFEPPGTDDKPIAMEDAASEIVDYMLFVGEAPLAEDIHGSSGFRERFEQQGPFDRKGRSLRQFDLRRRLMRYPLSYMIYSPLFERLPGASKDAIYQRLWQVLSGTAPGHHLQRLSLDDRRAIVEILKDTKQDLPPIFHSRFPDDADGLHAILPPPGGRDGQECVRGRCHRVCLFRGHHRSAGDSHRDCEGRSASIRRRRRRRARRAPPTSGSAASSTASSIPPIRRTPSSPTSSSRRATRAARSSTSARSR